MNRCWEIFNSLCYLVTLCLCTPASLRMPLLWKIPTSLGLSSNITFPEIHTLALHSQRRAEISGNSNQSSIPVNLETVLLFLRSNHFIFFYLSQYDHGFSSCPYFMLILMLLKKYRFFPPKKHYWRYLCVGIRSIWEWVISNLEPIYHKKYLIHGGWVSNQAIKEL